MSEKRFKALKFNRAILNPIVRSLTAGRASFTSLVYHIGRRSGKEYATPVMAVLKNGYIYIPLTYGPDTDWCLNVQAAGFCRVKIKGKVYSANNPEWVDTSDTLFGWADFLCLLVFKGSTDLALPQSQGREQGRVDVFSSGRATDHDGIYCDDDFYSAENRSSYISRRCRSVFDWPCIRNVCALLFQINAGGATRCERALSCIP